MKAVAVVKYTFTAVGLLMIVLALAWYANVRAFIARAAVAPGTVVDLLPSRSDNSTTWRPVVRFTSADRQNIEFTSSTSSNPPSYSKGERVEVLYAPANPRDAKINGFFSLWGGPLIIGGVGAVFFLTGASIIAVGRLRARQNEYLRANGTRVQARFQQVERNPGVQVNGANPFRIVCQWQDPATAQMHVFRSANLWFDPTDHIKSKDLTVFIETGNPRKYLVDTSFLPKLAS